MREDDSFDKLLDALIDEAAMIAIDDLSKELPVYDDIEPSKELDARMEKLFQKEYTQLRWKKWQGYPRRAAVFLLILITFSALSVLSVKAWRIRFLNFVLDTAPTNTKIQFEDEVKENIYSSDEITLGYVPEGFALEKSSSTEYNIYLLFRNNEKYFAFSINNIDSNLTIDTEDATTKKIKVNKLEAFYSSKSDVNILVWHNNENIFKLLGNISEYEMLKIAENTNY